VIILTGIYRARSDARQAELHEAMRRNLANPFIEQVVAVNEGARRMWLAQPWANDPKLRVLDLMGRTRKSYAAMLNIANALGADKQVCLINADCFLDETIEPVLRLPLRRTFIALSRRKTGPDGTMYGLERTAAYSQDAWIFRTPVRVPMNATFTLGTPACDNCIVWLMHELGYEILNPALDVRLGHLHASEERNYPPQVQGVLRAGADPSECPRLPKLLEEVAA